MALIVAKRYGLVFAALLIIILLLVQPAAAEVCWGKICSSSPLKDSGLCAICCGGHGSCIGFNNCACESGYTGKECETPSFCGSCPNLCNSTSTGVCSPLSTSGDSGSCYCANGYTGTCCNVNIADWGGSNGGEAALLVPSSHAFGNVTIGSAAVPAAMVSYVNDGAYDSEEITGITISGVDASDFVADTSACWPGMAIPAKGICTIPVNFTPSVAGSRTATLTVTTTSRQREMSLNGTGTSRVSSIIIDPLAKARVFAGIDGAGIYRSTDSGGSWLPATLTPVTTRVKALVMKPGDGTLLFAGTYGSGVYRSADSGATWTACANTGLANRNVLALVSNSTGGLYAGTGDGIYTSTDCNMWTAPGGGLP
jgi:hypothetical protein